MNKTELIEVVAKEAGLKKKDAEAAVNAVVTAISDALAAGEKVAFTGIGVFAVKERAARTGRNPRTNAKIAIPASKHIAFTAGKVLKDKVNK